MEKRLIAAILIQAVKDWRRPQYRRDVEVFVRSAWFSQLVEAIELDQAALRSKLMAGEVSNRSLRAVYRKG